MGLKALGEVPLEVKSLLVMNDHFKHKETKLLQSYYKVRNNARNQYNQQH